MRLAEREELRDHDVLERHHAHGRGEDLTLLSARDQLLRDGPGRRLEDEVDEHVAVVGLHEPSLRRMLDPEPRLGEDAGRALDVPRLDEEVDVVIRARAAACPCRERAAEDERHLVLAQGGRGLLHRLADVGELGHGLRRYPAPVRGETGRIGVRTGDEMVRVAAAADVHAAPDRREALTEAFASLDRDTDLVLVAGDLTTHGEPDQARGPRRGGHGARPRRSS